MKPQKIRNLLDYVLMTHLAIFLFMMSGTLAMAANPDNAQPGFSEQTIPFPSAQAEMNEAQKELDAAGKQFTQGEKASSNSSQRTGQTTWSHASSAPAATAPAPMTDPRAQALQGSPETGYAGTWTDPATGDTITSVIAPAPRQDSWQDTPIIVEPQIDPSWNGSGSSWSGGNYGGGGSNWNGQNWSESHWPVGPGNPGYPGQPYGVPGTIHPPYPGGMHYHHPVRPYHGYLPSYPPNGSFNPHYRPLLPPRPPKPDIGNNGSIWNPNRPEWPSQPGSRPPQFNIPGWKPFPPVNNHWGPPPMGSGPMRPGGPVIMPRGGF